jgi:hypothetical protein
LESIIFSQDLTQAIVRDRIDMMIVATGHALIVDQSIDEVFLWLRRE